MPFQYIPIIIISLLYASLLYSHVFSIFSGPKFLTVEISCGPSVLQEFLAPTAPQLPLASKHEPGVNETYFDTAECEASEGSVKTTSSLMEM